MCVKCKYVRSQFTMFPCRVLASPLYRMFAVATQCQPTQTEIATGGNAIDCDFDLRLQFCLSGDEFVFLDSLRR